MYGQPRDLELNFKGSNLSGSPPPVPARHFNIDSCDDLPPPIPERKCSLDSGIEEEFPGRFGFRPLSTAPLPEPYSNCSKSYPSRMFGNQALQRPAHHPPPPPPPVDLSSSPTEEKSINITRSLPHQLKHANTPVFTASTSSINGTSTLKENFQQSLYNDVPDDYLDLPPPPARRPPPPPPSKMKMASAVSTFIPSTPVSTAGAKSPKLKGLPPLKLPAIPPADTELTQNLLTSLLTTPPFTPPPPPPPPPHTWSCFSEPTTKHVRTNGLSKIHVSNARSATTARTITVQEMKKYKEPPQLPAKPSQTSTTPSSSLLGTRKPLPQKPTANGIEINKTKIINLGTQQQPLPLRSVSPLPKMASVSQSSTLSVSALPNPNLGSRTHHPNKNRPLPTIPSVLTGKKAAPSKPKDGWGGVEVFDPREEDGDIYDVMDSTDM